MGDVISQVFVIHKSGVVVLSRIYQESCLSSDPQLIGGILSALITLIQYDTGNGKYCVWEADGKHRLRDIGMSCSRWFIVSHMDFTLAVLVPHSSPLVKLERYDAIQKLNEAILNSFAIFFEFDDSFVDGEIQGIKDYSIEFGNMLDSLIFENLYDNLGIEIKFEKGEFFDLDNLI